MLYIRGLIHNSIVKNISVVISVLLIWITFIFYRVERVELPVAIEFALHIFLLFFNSDKFGSVRISFRTDEWNFMCPYFNNSSRTVLISIAVEKAVDLWNQHTDL